MTDEEVKDIPKTWDDVTPESWADTIADTKQQLAEAYLLFLDQQKGWVFATGAWLWVNLNPLQKDAIEYLTTETAVTDKTDILSTIGKNIKKKVIEKFTWWTMIEYDKIKLNKMKALIVANKDNQTKLQELITQIQAGTDPTVDAPVVDDKTKTPVVAPVVTPEKVVSEEYQDPFDIPAKDLTITSWFWYRTHPVTGIKNSPHYGIDIWVALWTPIHAIEAWKVTFSGRSDSGGNMITIESADGRTFSYLHMKDPSTFKKDDLVTTTDVIWNIGSTGSSTGPHLHLAEKKDGEFVNPLKDEKITPLFEEYKNYETLAVSDIVDQNDMKTAA